MLRVEKHNFTRLKQDEPFFNVIKKLSLHESLNEDEKVYVLACAIIFLLRYQEDRRYLSYADFAYYIILHYAIITEDYIPLFDFATNFWFYPITKEILKIRWIEKQSLIDGIISSEIELFKNESWDYIETQEQNHASKSLLNDNAHEKSYIAPTSFGKSSLIIDIIKKTEVHRKKIAIIVPTKSLLTQTYKNIVKSGIESKILLHEWMFNEEEYFIAIFTQERALRLMDIKAVHYDILIIDEAHNMLDWDGRALLLSRLIKKNKKINPDHEVVYLSPLVENSDNLRISVDQSITPYNVKFNIKEPVFFEYKETTNEVFLFNRFLWEFYLIDQTSLTWEDYIINTSGKRKFLYKSKPREIEELALSLTLKLPRVDSVELSDLKDTLTNQVHENFNLVKALDYWVIYLHWKLPDIIKEYVESKYKKIPKIKYLVANNVILEGMNLPIDSLYICSYYKLTPSKLMNLIGRVNRLWDIFNDDLFDFQKLIPSVHFLCNNDDWRHNNKLINLRSRIFKDSVKNPVLASFDMDENIKERPVERKEKYRNEMTQIQEYENMILQSDIRWSDGIKKYIIEQGINSYYSSADLLVSDITSKISLINQNEWRNLSLLDKIHYIFITNIDNISDDEFGRLKYDEARNYYEAFILVGMKMSLKDRIDNELQHLLEKSQSDTPYLYIWTWFGEVPYPYSTEAYQAYGKEVYVNLAWRTTEYLVNLAIVKLKIEEDFISFTISKFTEFLYKYELITEDEYNKYIYGTENQSQIALTKTWLSISLISRLERDNQLQNLYLDQNNNLCANEEFWSFLNQIDDFYRFEIEKHLIV